MKILIGLIIMGTLIVMNRERLLEGIAGINNEFDNFFVKWGTAYGVNPKHVKAIGLNESYLGEFDNFVEVRGNTTGGIMHVELPTAQDYFPELTFNELIQDETSIQVGTRHFRWLLDQFDQYEPGRQLEYAVKAYNGGVGRMNQLLRGRGSFSSDEWERISRAGVNMQKYWERFNRNLNRIG